jgi:hypothetical protein
MYTQNGWRAFAPERLKTHGIWPNQLLHNHHTGEGVLVVQQSPNYEEYAISAGGLDYLTKAVAEERITAGFVVLQNRQGEEVARKPVSEVTAQVENLGPRQGRLGPYFWFYEDLTVQGLTDLF